MTTKDMARHPMYPIINEEGKIRLPSRIMAFVFVLTLPAIATVGGVVLAVFGKVSAVDLGLLVGMFLLGALGISLGYHRLFTHRSFEAPKLVRWTLAFLGAMNGQGAPILWAAAHRQHHAYSDQAGDPHSPHEGRKPGLWGVLRALWHAHFGYIINQVEPIEPERYVPDLARDPFLKWMEKWSTVPVVLGMLLPFAAGWLLSGSYMGGLTGLLWGGWIRLFAITQTTGSVNSICHFFGSRRFVVEDRSGNVAWLVPFTLGECWHHNHHAFPTSARHGLRWWELDPSWMVIRCLEFVGLVWNVVRIDPERQRQKLSGSTERV